MKFFLSCLILLTCMQIGFAQDKNQTHQHDNEDKHVHDDEYAHENLGRYFDEYKYNIAPEKSIDFYNDTLLSSFHRFEHAGSALMFTTGNIGLPITSMIFENKKEHNEFSFYDNYMPFIHTHKNTNFFNAKRPFTIFRFNGGEKDLDEVRLLHTQNVNSSFNFGADYRVTNSQGTMASQTVKNTALNVFTAYTNHRYEVHADFIFNKNSHFNSGGILTDSLFEETDTRIENIPTFLSNSQATLSQIGTQYVHEYKFGPSRVDTIYENNDTLKIKSFPGKLSLQHKFSFNRYKRQYSNTDTSYYINNYFANSDILDSLSQININNEFLIKYKLKQDSSYLSQIATGVIVNNENYQNFADYYKDSLQEIFTNTGLVFYYTQKGSKNLTNLYLDYYLTGRKQFNYNAKFKYIHTFKANNFVALNLKHSVTTPDFFNCYYSSNNFRWYNSDFKNSIYASGNVKYIDNKYRFNISASYSLLDNYIIYNNDALPEQITNTNNIISLSASKKLNFNWFNWDNTITYQYVQDRNKLPLPDLSGLSNVYVHFPMFNNALVIDFGLDLWYHNKTYAYAYMPATGVFYTQNEKEIGNYFMMDVYLSFKIKRARGFIRAGNTNDLFMQRRYFNTLHNPDRPFAINFGISWEFYD